MNPMASILNEITTTKAEETDYLGEDGLLYCGKCRTPKQLRLEKNGFFGDHPVPTLCRYTPGVSTLSPVGPGSKYVWLCRPYSSCCNYSAFQFGP